LYAINVAGAPDFRRKTYPSCELFVPSSIDAIKSDTSGLPVSAEVASIAILVTEPNVPLFSLTSPVPGSAILVELSKVYFHANAPADASAFVALVADAVALEAEAVAEVAELVACVLAVEAEVEALDACVLAVEAEVEALDACVLAVLALLAAAVADVAAAVAEVAAAVAEVAAAVALVAAAVAEVVALAASTSNAHLATSALLDIGCDPEDVCAVIQM
jgi:hypothetical protein